METGFARIVNCTPAMTPALPGPPTSYSGYWFDALHQRLRYGHIRRFVPIPALYSLLSAGGKHVLTRQNTLDQRRGSGYIQSKGDI